MPAPASPIGDRICVIGQSCSGKSTLAARLAAQRDKPFVELDALHWVLPDWMEPPDEDFSASIREATAGDSWVVAGSYSRLTREIFWQRPETVIWRDYPLPLLLGRIVARSWRRWRTKELLWGTNRERFWEHCYTRDSLIYYTVRHRRLHQRSRIAEMADPRFAHIDFVHLRSPAHLERWYAHTVAGAGATTVRG